MGPKNRSIRAVGLAVAVLATVARLAHDTPAAAAPTDAVYAATAAPVRAIALGAQYPIVTGHRVAISCAGRVTGVTWYRTPNDIGAITVGVWKAGTLVGSGATTASGGAGWATVALTSPLGVAPGDELVVGVHHPNGSYGVTLDGLNGRGLVSSGGCLSVPATSAAAGNGLYAYSASLVRPQLTYLASEYFVAPEFEPTLAPTTTAQTDPTAVTSTTTGVPTTVPVVAGPPARPLYGTTEVPAETIALGAVYAIQTGQRIAFDCSGTVDGVWWYRTAAEVGVTTVSAWSGSTLVAQTTTVVGAVGWTYTAFASPVPVGVGSTLVLGVHRPNGAYPVTVNGFAGRGRLSGCTRISASTPAAPNGLYDYRATPGLPTLSYAASDYWVAPGFTPTAPGATTTTTTTPTATTTTTSSATTTTATSATTTTTTSAATTTTTLAGTTTTTAEPVTTTPEQRPPDGTGPGTSDFPYPAGYRPANEIALGPTYPITVGHRVGTGCSGRMTGIWWYRTTADTGTITIGATRNGVTVATGSGDPAPGPGWRYVAFDEPTYVVPGQEVIVSILHANGAYGVTPGGLDAAKNAPSSCTALPASAPGRGNGLYSYGATTPSQSYISSDYAMAPAFEAVV